MIKKISFIILLLLITIMAKAEDKPINLKYSYKAFPFHDLHFRDISVEEFNDTRIVGSCFYQEYREGDKTVVKDIFPKGMKGVKFERCNLDNIYVDETKNTIGTGVEDWCSHKKVKVQNDLCDWILNEDETPKEPIDKEKFIELGISIDPKDIPKTKLLKDNLLTIKTDEKIREKNTITP